MKNTYFITALAFFVLCAPVSMTAFAWGGQEGKAYLIDVEREAGKPLTDDEKKIVDSVFIFYNAKYGYSVKDITPQIAAKNMNAEEYKNTVTQAAKVSKNKAAKGLLATGKVGEKLLKAIIITTEEAAKATGTWIDKKSTEYDKRKK